MPEHSNHYTEDEVLPERAEFLYDRVRETLSEHKPKASEAIAALSIMLGVQYSDNVAFDPELRRKFVKDIADYCSLYFLPASSVVQ